MKKIVAISWLSVLFLTAIAFEVIKLIQGNSTASLILLMFVGAIAFLFTLWCFRIVILEL